ncbi:MAG: hypothetical protein KDA89_01765 [Planctomycetaceae bacterium]|nr:hypothetical protein [Planctomycetaceae bacterium]MCA9047423.1 hypothetical protein [Planctomycetaceae bacterium]
MNPYQPPQSDQTTRPADPQQDLREAARAIRLMGYVGVVYIAGALSWPILAALLTGRKFPIPDFTDGMGIGCGLVLFAFYGVIILTGIQMQHSFPSVARRARWMAIIGGTIAFPILTFAAWYAVSRMNRYQLSSSTRQETER